uniref:(northern house mosquito) hypothetical protein n=1 Tax=Culex pipiens TaxID=7175 RepID=A0A8D8F9E9_CULPI
MIAVWKSLQEAQKRRKLRENEEPTSAIQGGSDGQRRVTSATTTTTTPTQPKQQQAHRRRLRSAVPRERSRECLVRENRYAIERAEEEQWEREHEQRLTNTEQTAKCSDN